MSIYVHRLCKHCSSRCALVSVKLWLTTEFTQPMYIYGHIHHWLPTSYCRDGGSGNPMAVAHSYCYKLLISTYFQPQVHVVTWWIGVTEKLRDWDSNWSNFHQAWIPSCKSRPYIHLPHLVLRKLSNQQMSQAQTLTRFLPVRNDHDLSHSPFSTGEHPMGIL